MIAREYNGLRGLARAPWDERDDGVAAADAADAADAALRLAAVEDAGVEVVEVSPGDWRAYRGDELLGAGETCADAVDAVHAVYARRGLVLS